MFKVPHIFRWNIAPNGVILRHFFQNFSTSEGGTSPSDTPLRHTSVTLGALVPCYKKTLTSRQWLKIKFPWRGNWQIQRNPHETRGADPAAMALCGLTRYHNLSGLQKSLHMLVQLVRNYFGHSGQQTSAVCWGSVDNKVRGHSI